jgi:DNA (cytosine-5)-methyltransferase 1
LGNECGVFANAFPIESELDFNTFELPSDIVDISDNFSRNAKMSPFLNAGVMCSGRVSTVKISAKSSRSMVNLEDILLDDQDVPDSFYIDPNDLEKWNYLKGSKKEVRKTKDGFKYHYSEGGMVFPDDLKKPSRTIITGEGGKSPSRFKHVVKTKKGLRRLAPVELERLNMFPDNHTLLEGITDAKRAFFMGNALVVGVVDRIGGELYARINKS